MIEKTTADPAMLARYDRFVAEAGTFTVERAGDLSARHEHVETAPGYEQAADRAADLAYASGRVVQVDDDGADDYVPGAAEETREIGILVGVAGGGALDLAFAILTRDLLDPDDYRMLTEWAKPVVDVDAPDDPAPASPAGPPEWPPTSPAVAPPTVASAESLPAWSPTPPAADAPALPQRRPRRRPVAPVTPEVVPHPTDPGRNQLVPAPEAPLRRTAVVFSDEQVAELVAKLDPDRRPPVPEPAADAQPAAAAEPTRPPGKRRPAQRALRRLIHDARAQWIACRIIRATAYTVAVLLAWFGFVLLGSGAAGAAGRTEIGAGVIAVIGGISHARIFAFRRRYMPRRDASGDRERAKAAERQFAAKKAPTTKDTK